MNTNHSDTNRKISGVYRRDNFVKITLVLTTFCLPACNTTSLSHTPAQNQFSARSPCDLECHKRRTVTPVSAHYAAEADAANAPHTVPTATAVYGTPENAATSLQELSGRQTSMLPAAGNSEFQLTSHRTGYSSQAPDGFIPAEPRMDCPPGTPYSNAMETVAAGPSPDVYADEYLIDGGDRESPVQSVDGGRFGLDSEDTVAQFADHTGAKRIKPSNRVAVYSPRFGSVRTVSGLETDIKVDKALGARDLRGPGSLKTGQQPAANVRESGIVGLDSRRRADAADSAIPASESKESLQASQSRKFDKGLEDRKYTGPYQLGTFDAAIQSQQARNAVVWTRNLFPQMTAGTASAGALKATFRLQQTVGIEDERKTKGDIRILKLADRESAQAGDIVTFTIQYENTGDFDVYDVKIVDNLTPRLQYVADSAVLDSVNPGEVSVAPNGEGSQVLTFTLQKPLEGHGSGEIRFQTRVR